MEETIRLLEKAIAQAKRGMLTHSELIQMVMRVITREPTE